ncbi:MAG: hypothetical protein HY304_06660 [candidate division Zixibacteria bacterium]|nr:hypothetical protein [candidate division Zixibacteria bacterium]
MRCYFSSEKPGLPHEPGDGFVSFVIPELSITFRARYRGTAAACEYASLLALLEFVEINPKLFAERTIEILGDSFTVVNQVNNRLLCRRELEAFRNTALILRQRIPYTIDWVARRENPAGPQAR